MGIIFYSSIFLIWTFNTRDVYDFITKKANIQVNLVPILNDVSLLLCRFVKSGVTNELKNEQCREHAFLFQLTLTINIITPINITLRILEKK